MLVLNKHMNQENNNFGHYISGLVDGEGSFSISASYKIDTKKGEEEKLVVLDKWKNRRVS